MADDFYISVLFDMENVNDMEALEILIAHFNLFEIDEARNLLSQRQLITAQQHIDKLTTQYNNYTRIRS